MIDAFFYALFFTMSRIPYRIAQFGGKVIGILFSLVPMNRRGVALENILRSFDGDMRPEDCRKLLMKIYVHFGRMLFEVPHILRLNRQNLSRYVVFENEDNLREALARDKGVFILTAHFGNWELMSAAVRIHFEREAAIVVRPLDFTPLDRMIGRLRTRFGTEVIPKQRAMRRIFSAIKEKKILGILLDQNVAWYEGVFLPFFGRWACTNKGLAQIALKTGAPVIPVFPVRQEDGRHRIIIEKEITLEITGDKTKDVEENTILFTRVIENYIRRYPDQWFWFHKRWKTRNYCTLGN